MFVPGPETTAIKSNGQAKTKARSDLAPSEVSIGIYQALNTPERSHFGVFPHVESNKQQNNSWWILISLWNQNSNQVRTGADKLKRALGLLVTASHARQTRNRGKPVPLAGWSLWRKYPSKMGKYAKTNAKSPTTPSAMYFSQELVQRGRRRATSHSVCRNDKHAHTVGENKVFAPCNKMCFRTWPHNP